MAFDPKDFPGRKSESEQAANKSLKCISDGGELDIDWEYCAGCNGTICSDCAVFAIADGAPRCPRCMKRYLDEVLADELAESELEAV